MLGKVWDARVKWYEIGLGIKIRSTDLDAIGKRHRDDPDVCFRELLSTWLKQASPKPTWALLADALKSPKVGFGQLSEKLCSQSQIIECSGKSQPRRPEIVNLKLDQEVIRFKCPCSKCDIFHYLEKGCPKSNSSSYPYLELEGLSDRERTNVYQKLSTETEEIIKKFTRLLSSTRKSLKRRKIEPLELACVAAEYGSQQSMRNLVPLSEDDQRELKHAQSIDDAFLTLRKCISFFNHEILGYIINEIGDDDDNEHLELFYSDFKVFCMRKVVQVSPNVYSTGQDQMNHKQFVVLATKHLIETVADIKDAQVKIATLLGLEAGSIQVQRVDISSVIIVFTIPLSLSQKVFPLKPVIYEELKHCSYTLIVPPSLGSDTCHKVMYFLSFNKVSVAVMGNKFGYNILCHISFKDVNLLYRSQCLKE